MRKRQSRKDIKSVGIEIGEEPGCHVMETMENILLGTNHTEPK